jgi:hypothetical protein
MRYRYQYVSTQMARPGIALGSAANAVVGGAVSFSLPAGHVLTEDNIRQLQVHKVEFIFVVCEDVRSDAQVAEDAAQAAARVLRVFADADLSVPCMAALFDQVLAYRSS